MRYSDFMIADEAVNINHDEIYTLLSNIISLIKSIKFTDPSNVEVVVRETSVDNIILNSDRYLGDNFGEHPLFIVDPEDRYNSSGTAYKDMRKEISTNIMPVVAKLKKIPLPTGLSYQFGPSEYNGYSIALRISIPMMDTLREVYVSKHPGVKLKPRRLTKSEQQARKSNGTNTATKLSDADKRALYLPKIENTLKLAAKISSGFRVPADLDTNMQITKRLSAAEIKKHARTGITTVEAPVIMVKPINSIIKQWDPWDPLVAEFAKYVGTFDKKLYGYISPTFTQTRYLMITRQFK